MILSPSDGWGPRWPVLAEAKMRRPFIYSFFSLSLSFSTFFLNLHRFHFSEQGVRPLGTAGRSAAAVGAAVTGGAAAVLAAVGPPSGSSSPQWRNS